MTPLVPLLDDGLTPENTESSARITFREDNREFLTEKHLVQSDHSLGSDVLLLLVSEQVLRDGDLRARGDRVRHVRGGVGAVNLEDKHVVKRVLQN